MNNGPSRILYVDASHRNASDRNSGSETSPWATIQRAADAARAGDTIYVKAGVYEPFEITSSGKPGARIVFSAHPGDEHEAIIDGRGVDTRGGIEMRGQSHVEIKNFRVQNASDDGIFVEGSPGGDRDVVISGNQVDTTGNSGIYAAGLVMGKTIPVDQYRLFDVVIADNEVTNTNVPNGRSEAITLGGGVSGFEIRDNWVHDTLQFGIDVKLGARKGAIYGNLVHDVEKHAIYLDSGSRTLEDIEIYNNTLFKSQNGIALAREVIRGPKAPNIRDVEIHDNLIHDNVQFGVVLYRHKRDNGSGDFDDVRIHSNSICDNGRDGIQLDNIERFSTGIEVTDNALSGNGHPIQNRIGAKVEDNETGVKTSGTLLGDGTDALSFKAPLNAVVDNRPPVFTEARLRATEDKELRLDVSQFARDPDGGRLQVKIADQPDHGRASVSSDGTDLIYRPSKDHDGSDSVELAVADRDGATVRAELDIAVAGTADNPVAVAVGDVRRVEAGERVWFNALAANDRDADGDALRVVGVKPITQGGFDDLRISSVKKGVVTARVDEDARGTVAFEYTVADTTGRKDVGRVTLDLGGVGVGGDGGAPKPAPRPKAPEGSDDAALAINIGSKKVFTAADGTRFEGDYTGVGRGFAVGGDIKGTRDDVLYRSEAWSPGNLSYDFALPDGRYTVDLHFAEIYRGTFGDGLREFDVSLEGRRVLNDLDIHDEVGARTALVKTFTVEVRDGSLDLDLRAGVENPKLSAVAIEAAGGSSGGASGPARSVAKSDPGTFGDLALWDARRDVEIATLGERTVVHEDVFGGRAPTVVVEAPGSVQSVRMSFDGKLASLENMKPYALFGDRSGDLNGGAFDLGRDGAATIQAQYFSQDKAAGRRIATDAIEIERASGVMRGERGTDDVFVLDERGMGRVRIENIDSNDRIDFAGPTPDGRIANLARDAGRDAVLDFGGGNRLTLVDVEPGEVAGLLI